MKYTYNLNYAAHVDGPTEIVTIPDQAARDQAAYDGKPIPVMQRDGNIVTAKLDGEAYGLYTTGTGDPVVSISD